MRLSKYTSAILFFKMKPRLLEVNIFFWILNTLTDRAKNFQRFLNLHQLFMNSSLTDHLVFLVSYCWHFSRNGSDYYSVDFEKVNISKSRYNWNKLKTLQPHNPPNNKKTKVEWNFLVLIKKSTYFSFHDSARFCTYLFLADWNLINFSFAYLFSY